MSRLGRAAANLGLAAGAALVTIALAEVSLRLFGPESTGYYVFAPNTTTLTTPLTELMPGVEGTAEFRTNAHGMRGADLGADGSEYRILTFGGSTAQNIYLDQSEAWPTLVGSLLGPTADGRRTWSGSVGRSGATARTNVVQFRHLVPSLPRIDAAVMLLGVNDLGAALRQAWAYETPPSLADPAVERAHVRQGFVRVPGKIQDQFPEYEEGLVPLYRRLALWHVARLSRDAWIMRSGGLRQDRFGQTLVTWRAHRRNSRLVHDSLPPLEAPLAEYRGYLESMADIAEEHGVRLVLMTQPVLWRADLTAEEEALLWMGGTGDFQSDPTQAYFAPGPLAEGMRAYNSVLLDVCRERGVECVDLAAVVPADTSMFYDDVHPTEAGSRAFADALAAYLRETPPYR
ncbi:MAG: GDSL-type esterase/lipase family protein [Gemmatimonadota bacterium]